MPNIKCYVLGCKNNLSHRFPKNPEKRALWLEAIGRPGDNPRQDYGLCSQHFKKDDFTTVGWDTGVVLTRKRLKRDVIPTVNLPEVSPKRRSIRVTQPSSNLLDFESTSEDFEDNNLGEYILPDNVTVKTDFSDTSIADMHKEYPMTSPDITIDSKILSPSELCEVVMSLDESIGKVCESGKKNLGVNSKAIQCDKLMSHDVKTQTMGRLGNYTIFDYKEKPDVVQYFTGLDSYSKFMGVFNSLKTECDEVVYRNSLVLSVSLEDQLFMTLWKLRKNTPDFELALHFAVSPATVSIIIGSFVAFMAKHWGDLDTWPQRSLVDLYMPENFKKSSPSAKVVTNKTQVPSTNCIDNSETKAAQSTIKNVNNKNSVKVLVDANVLSSDPTTEESSTVAHQVVENCDILKKCKVGDLIMVDQSVNVEDLFGSKGVVISIPPSLKGKDPSLERLIGHAKSYKILAQQLSPYYVHIASEIFYVCVMLCHYHVNTITKKC